MVILQQPDILSLSGNIKEFRISSTDPVSFTLSQGGVEVLAQSYTPGKDGIITINLRDIVHSRLSFNLQESALVYEQTTLVSDFVADISGTRVTFRAIRSGVDRLADTATNFLTQNFLTWQPSLKAVTYYSPEFLTYYAVVPCAAKLRAYYTDTSGSEPSQQDITLADLTAGKAYTIPLQYASVAAKLGNKLPAYYDVFVESASGVRLTYIQRYYASDMLSEQEQWILFENSLGGIDTFRAYGSTEFSADHTHNIAEIDEVSTEYRVDTERKFQKNTGHLTTKERTWLLDFFPSPTKYIYAGTYLRPIVVLNSNVTYTDRELPSNYTFTYKYADSHPLLNLPRTDIPSEVLDITVPSVGSFTVPPRLVEFPRLPLTEGALFPIQQPYSEEWSTTTGGALYDFIAKRLSQNGNNGGVGHEHNNFDLLNILKYADGYLKVGDNKIKVGYADKAGSVDGVDLDLWKKKQDPDGNSYLYTDLPIVTRCGLITYNDDGTINLPDLYAGLPLDGTTIGRDASGALTVLGGVGSDFDKAQMWTTLSGSGAEQIHKSHLTDALAGYARTADIPSLSGYATESWVNDKGYVTTTRLNELIGGASSAFDTLKEIEDYINSHESVTAGLIASLGNKVDKVTGMGLSEHSFTTTLREKLNSIAEGANKYILPVAKAAVLGGVMIGSNINVNAQGVISVAAPYSHPTQQVITAGAARHFLTGLAVNQYGHVTSATSAALTKDDLLSVLKDEDGVIRLDAHIALTGGLINSANLGTVNIPSLYDGIPVDGKSIYWENGTLKSSSTGGGGLAKVIVKVGLAAYESVDGVVTLPAYPTMPDLTNYVTTNTEQNISGKKIYSESQYYNDNCGILTIDGKALLYSDGTRTITGDETRPHRIRSNDSNLEHWRTGVGRYDILDGYNWRSIIDGRYLLLTGGTLTGQTTISYSETYAMIYDGKSGYSVNNYQLNGVAKADIGYVPRHGTYMYNFTADRMLRINDDGTLKLSSSSHLEYEVNVWHAGNDGTGSGLDADLLDGLEPSDLSVSNAGYLRVNTIFNPNDHSTDSLKLKAYDCYNIVGTPTTYGNVLEINSGTNHWKPQLWFDAYRGGSIRYRNRGYNDSGFEDWRTLAFVDGTIANSDKLGGLRKEVFMRYEGWINAPGYDANTMAGNTSGFTYSNNAPYNGPIVNIEAGGYNLELNGTYSGASMLAFRTRNGDTSSWNSWEYLARTIDNVASATKLQSARLIYGQNFDGTTNISGALSDVRSITSLINLPIDYVSQQGQYFYTNNNKTTPLLSLTGNVGIGTASPIKTFEVWGSSLFNLSNRNTTTVGSFGAGNCLSLQSSNHEKYGLYGWITGSGDFHWQSGRDDGNSSMYNILFQEYGGNICFGNTAAISKVNVYGAIRATDAVYGGRIFAGFDAGVPNSMSCSDWFRSSGPTGWFNQTYSGGIYMADSDQVRVYNNKVLYNDGFRQWGIGGHHCGIKLYNQDHIGINLATASYTWGIYANTDGNIYIGRRDGDINNTTGSYYLIIGAGTMTYNGSIVLNGGGLITYSSDIRLKEIQGYFKPSLNELAALPIFAHSWRNGTPGVQLSTSAQAVQKIMPWNVFEGDDGYLKMDGTRTALAVSIRLAQLANEYITNNERWKSDKDRQIEALQREVKELKQQLNVA